MKAVIRAIGASLLAGFLASATLGSARSGAQAHFAEADHHMHILSAAGAHLDELFCDKIGRDECGDLLQSSTGADALQALDAAGIRQGVLLSTAYMAGSPELKEAPKVLARNTRAENTYVVDQARLSCGRLVAFVSVNPNSPNALDEIDYWRRHGGAAGLKLHLANSDFDFSSSPQVVRLAAVFRAAAAARFPIVIHMRNRNPDYGAKEVEIFLRQVLPAARGVSVQIAHSGGWGGADHRALSALGAFAEAIKRDPKGTDNLYFDMAMMPDTPKHPASREAIARYVSLMRKIGLKRFLLASDWTKGTNLKVYYESVKQRLNLTPAEWQEIAWNTAPYLHRNGKSVACAAARS
ncbi:MAG: amidohydrolase family protein [Edaphobacter sp.]